MTDTYEELCREGRELVAREQDAGFQWAWGDLAMRVAELTPKGTRTTRGSLRIVDPAARARAKELKANGLKHREIAEILNREGYQPPSGETWTLTRVANAVIRDDVPVTAPPRIVDRLDAWAADVGFYETGRSLVTLNQYRYCSLAWAPHTRKNASWSAHNWLRDHSDRWNLLRDGMSSVEVMKLLGYKPRHQIAVALPRAERIIAAIQTDPTGAGRTVLDSPATLAAQIVTFRDPEKLEALFADKAIRKMLTKNSSIRADLLRELGTYLWDNDRELVAS